MKIRAKLALSMTALVAAVVATLGYGVLAASKEVDRRDAVRLVDEMRATMQKADTDALVQRDELSLVAYATFARRQSPWLGRVRISWWENDHTHSVDVGDPPPSARLKTVWVTAADPRRPKRTAILRLDIDDPRLQDYVSVDDRLLVKLIVLLGALTMAAGLLMALWIATSLTAPLTRLDALAAEIAAGRLGASMDWTSNDEIGRLVHSFNQMSRRLEELDETKRRFISSVTHELRSPLGAIESFIDLIELRVVAAAGPDGAQCRDYLGRIRSNIERLGRFINDLLDVSKIESGRMECSLRSMDLEPVLTEVCQFFFAKSTKQGVGLAPHFPPLPRVLGDPDRLRQVFVNLVSNALKFTPSGGRITIEAQPRRDGEGKSWVDIVVRDTGRGMSPNEARELFKPFYQGGNVSQRVAGANRGTGLGLYIVRSIIEQHGGRVSVESAPDRGTSVSFSLAAA